MEKNQNLIFIGILVLIFMGGYLTHSVLVKDRDPEVIVKEVEKECEVCEVCESCTTPTSKFWSTQKTNLERRMYSISTDSDFNNLVTDVVIEPNGKAYAIFNENLINNQNFTLFKERLKDYEKIDTCDSEFCFEDGYYTNIANAIKVFHVRNGNGGYQYTLILTSTGELYGINTGKLYTIAEETDFEIYKVGTLKDIVSVEYWGIGIAYAAVATDINGKIFPLYDYLK